MLKAESLTFGAKLLQAGLNFLMVMLLSRFLSVGDRGEAALLLVLVAISLAFSEIASGSTVVTILGRYSFSTLLKVYAAWSCLVCIVAAIVLVLLQKFSLTIILLWTCASWLLCVTTFAQHLLLGNRKWLLYNLLQILSALLPLVVFLICLIFVPHPSVWHYALSLMVGWLLAAVFSLKIIVGLPQSKQNPASLTLGEVVVAMFSRGFINQLCHLFSIGLNRLLYIFLPAATLGVYANAAALGEAVWMIPGSVGAVLYARKVGAANQAKATAGVGKLLLLSTGLAAFAYIILSILPSQLFAGIFGQAYEAIPRFLILLSPGMLVFTIYLFLSYWHSSRDLFSENLKAVIAGLSAALVFVFYVGRAQAIGAEMLIAAQTLGWSIMSSWLLVSFLRKRVKG